jgi:hypothetical protein
MFKITLGTVERKIPIVFPNLMVHKIVAAVSYPLLQEHWPKAKIELASAGDFNMIDGECSGRSESLGIESQPEDGHVIMNHDYFHGIS